MRNFLAFTLTLRRFTLVLLVVCGQAVLSGCTEAAHASIWIELPLSGEHLLVNTLVTSGWIERERNPSGEVIFRNPSLPHCFIRKGSAEKRPTELVFVSVGTKRFRATEAVAYHQLAADLAAAFGNESVRLEAIDAV
ncbi:MAG: hypothetical protein KIT13_02180 [Burkholderiales bacterium]|nr:hypothetical protein [Burkholderiales bacterium]MCW5603213.1 hypothetical protein [Burkholderiales bacterium]